MPKNKFEILKSSNPIEEVTLQRVNSPLSNLPEMNDALNDDETGSEGKAGNAFFSRFWWC